MMDGWTLEELVRRVADALAADDVRAPNGRVREVPDARAIRWYTTIGLMDRPVGFRGRTALYGPRHLLQAVAVKRRQAQGHALAQIQAELAGAADATLRRVAAPAIAGPPPAVPASGPTPASASAPAREPARRRGRFWVAPPATAPAELRYRVALAAGVALDLPAAPSHRDITDIRTAAEPLMRLLAERGLIPIEEPSDDAH